MKANMRRKVSNSPVLPNKRNNFEKIYDILVNLNPHPVINRVDYMHYSNRCYAATHEIIKLLTNNK